MSQRSGIFLACDTLPQNPWSRDRIPAIRKALHGRRHEIVDIYDFGSVAQAHYGHRVRARDFFRERDLDTFNRIFIERILHSGCRIAVVGTVDNFGHFLLPETLRTLRREGVFTVGILGDDEFNFQHHWPWVFMFDRVVAYVKSMVSRYDALRPGSCLFLPNSCYFTERNFELLQMLESDKKHNVALFGSVFPARLRLVEKLANAGVPLSLFGSKGWLKSDILAPYYRGFVESESFDDTVRESRVVLALLEDHITGAPHMNTKIWEAVRNGQVCVATRYEPLVRDYGLVEGEDILFYDSAEDLAGKALHLLRHPDDRKRMAKRLFTKILTRFDYADLYEALFARIEAESQTDRGTRLRGSSAAVTLLGAPTVEDERSGFPVWRFSCTPGWKNRIAAEMGERVKTPYVIFTSGRFRYDSSLHDVLNCAPSLSNGVARLRSSGDNTVGWDTILWQTEKFVQVFLRGSLRQRIQARSVAIGFIQTILANRVRFKNRKSSFWTRTDAWVARAGRKAQTQVSKTVIPSD